MDLLEQHDVNIGNFPAHALDELVEEVASKDSLLVARKGELIRSLQIVKVWLQTELDGVPHVLVPTRKVKNGKVTFEKGKAITMKMKAEQSWEQGVALALSSRLGLEEPVQRRLLNYSAYHFSEEIEFSKSYPGLKTAYGINEVTCTVLEPHRLIGLPEGSDVSFTRTTFDDSKNVSEVHVLFYSWKKKEEVYHGAEKDKERRTSFEVASRRASKTD
jgi:hypothetical protein